MIRWLRRKLQQQRQPKHIPSDPQDDPSNLGQLMLRAGIISREQLNGALVASLTAQRQGQHLRVGEALIAIGAVTPADVRLFLDRQRAERSGKSSDVARYVRTVAAS